jgi:transcriptional regulator with XRE-family HTH domain
MPDNVYIFVSMAELPNKIRALRKARGWTLEYVANELDCSIPQIADLEKGLRTLHYDWMVRIARVFGVAPADLLLDKDVPDRLSDDERALINQYRAGSEQDRQKVQAMADVILPWRGPPPQPPACEEEAA